MTKQSPRAVVLFSGGQDSTTCLAWALAKGYHVDTLGFDYGQRHRVELSCRANVLDAIQTQFPHWADQFGEDLIAPLPALGVLAQSALTQDQEIAMAEDGLPNTFVPGRNLVFLSYAGAWAYRRGAGVLVGGMCETDYSGYPDCRRQTLDAMQQALSLGMDHPIAVETPLMWRDKAQTWAMAQELGGAALVEVIVQHTHTCYKGVRYERHDWGYGCGECPACVLRRQGFQAWSAGR